MGEIVFSVLIFPELTKKEVEIHNLWNHDYGT